MMKDNSNFSYPLQILFAGDTDANCKKTYFANYDISEEQWHTDIHDFNAKPYKGKIDLFVGGAPCQAFSIVGDQRGFEDTRGTLFREFARVVKECNPKVEQNYNSGFSCQCQNEFGSNCNELALSFPFEDFEKFQI